MNLVTRKTCIGSDPFEMVPKAVIMRTSLLLNWVLRFNGAGACHFWHEAISHSQPKVGVKGVRYAEKR